MHVQYIRNFAIGTSTHIIRVYANYTEANGLDGLIEERESTRMADCLRGLDITPAHRERIKWLMREKVDGIVLDDLRFMNY